MGEREEKSYTDASLGLPTPKVSSERETGREVGCPHAHLPCSFCPLHPSACCTYTWAALPGCPHPSSLPRARSAALALLPACHYPPLCTNSAVPGAPGPLLVDAVEAIQSARCIEPGLSSAAGWRAADAPPLEGYRVRGLAVRFNTGLLLCQYRMEGCTAKTSGLHGCIFRTRRLMSQLQCMRLSIHRSALIVYFLAAKCSCQMQRAASAGDQLQLQSQESHGCSLHGITVHRALHTLHPDNRGACVARQYSIAELAALAQTGLLAYLYAPPVTDLLQEHKLHQHL